MRVFVLDTDKKPLSPCVPARARRLLKMGRAAVYRLKPFTIILKRGVEDPIVGEKVEVKLDPGSKTTGMVLVVNGDVVFAANLHHRGHKIRALLESRRASRRARRQRKTRYREARFDNRRRPVGWLPPSIQSRVGNVVEWFKRLGKLAPVQECHVETVRFDTQKMQKPEISGREYQRGELFGAEVREYLLEKWGRKCAYCGKEGVPLEVEHIHAKSHGGSDRISNLTLACIPCNQKKSNRDIRDFLKGKPERLRKIESQAKAPLKDAAAVNATRYAIGNAIRAFGLPTSFWSGGRTKWNRTRQGYAKDHWIDAACVGESGATVNIDRAKPITITALSRGSRQVSCVDRYGFPRGKPGTMKRAFGFSAGDLVRLVQPKGKYTGVWIGFLAGIRARGDHDVKTMCGKKITARHSNYQLLQRGDGYAYA